MRGAFAERLDFFCVDELGFLVVEIGFQLPDGGGDGVDVLAGFGFVGVLQLDVILGLGFHVGECAGEGEGLVRGVELVDCGGDEPEVGGLHGACVRVLISFPTVGVGLITSYLHDHPAQSS